MGTKRPAGRAPVKKKPQRRRGHEEPRGNGVTSSVIATALIGLAVLIVYVSYAVPQAGTAMDTIRAVCRGLMGDLSILFGLMLVYGGVLCAFSSRGKRIMALRAMCNMGLFICGFMIAQVIAAENVITAARQRNNGNFYEGWFNFIAVSYRYGHGGGAFGAVFAWYPKHLLGTVGGVLAGLVAALLLLTATGRTGRFLKWSKGRTDVARERIGERRAEAEARREQMKEKQAAAKSNDLPAHFDEEQARARRGGMSQADYDFWHKNLPEKKPAPQRPRPTDRKKPKLYEETCTPKPKKEPPKALERAPKREISASMKQPVDITPLPLVAEETPPETRAPETDVPPIDPIDPFDAGATFEAPSEINAPTFTEIKPEPTAREIEKAQEKEEYVRQKMGENLEIVPEKSEVLEEAQTAQIEPMGKIHRPAQAEKEEEEKEEYFYPPIDLLPSGETTDLSALREHDLEKAHALEEVLKQFGVETTLTGIAHGPAVTRYELQPAPGIKVSRIASLSDDIAMHLAAMSVRIEAPIPGKAAVGVEIPNDKIEMVRLRDVLESSEAQKASSRIAVCLGKDNSGRYIVADIAKMPHVLIAGQTGSGKSVCINAIITSILYRANPDEVKLILIDPKVVELSIYNGIPHLVCPVVTDPKKASSALEWAVAEMTSRYKLFAERSVRDIKGYNKEIKPGEKRMPQMVIIIDELADLMMVCPGEVEDSICRLAQLARAAGMHLVIATQRPSVNVVTGIIKANIPTRIAFSVASQVDSRTMIDHGGAEKLLGNGDMLFVPSGANKSIRVQGAWVSDEEVHAVTEYVKNRTETHYDEDMIEQMDNAVKSDAEKEETTGDSDPRLAEAVEIVVEAGQASVSMLQRRMRVGYARAGRLIDEMEVRGIVSPANGSKVRDVLVTKDRMHLLFDEA